MNYPEEWTQAQVDSFYNWVAEHPAFRSHVSGDFPNLKTELLGMGLRSEDAEQIALYLKWLGALPYADFSLGRAILCFYYTEFQKIKRALERQVTGKRLCDLFRVLAQMVVQGTPIFPVRAASMAEELMRCLKQYPAGAARFKILARLMVDVNGGFMHGFNAEELSREELNLLMRAEHQRRANLFEELYVTREKYEGYKVRVMENVEFLRDVSILRNSFRTIIRPGKRVLQSDLADQYASDQPGDSGFQEAFDFFCWKWFLDGLEGYEPIVTKLSFHVTPFGTAIFIPGYWSFDPKRDIKWSELKEFHESRGAVKRQGSAFEPNRRDRQNKERLVLAAAEESRARGERGKKMIQSIIAKVGLVENIAPEYIYRLIREAKKTKQRRP